MSRPLHTPAPKPGFDYLAELEKTGGAGVHVGPSPESMNRTPTPDQIARDAAASVAYAEAEQAAGLAPALAQIDAEEAERQARRDEAARVYRARCDGNAQ